MYGCEAVEKPLPAELRLNCYCGVEVRKVESSEAGGLIVSPCLETCDDRFDKFRGSVSLLHPFLER